MYAFNEDIFLAVGLLIYLYVLWGLVSVALALNYQRLRCTHTCTTRAAASCRTSYKRLLRQKGDCDAGKRPECPPSDSRSKCARPPATAGSATRYAARGDASGEETLSVELATRSKRGRGSGG